MADVHLGARHDDLGPAASAQRERQFAAFARAIELAVSEGVDLVLICGDLFDSNAQPRRSVERAATELSRLVERHIPVVIIPGTHDCYDPSSIYRVFDLTAMSGAEPDSNLVTVLNDTRLRVDFQALDLTVHAFVYPTKSAPSSPLAGFAARSGAKPLAWQVGMIHGSMRIPGKLEQDDVIFTEDEVAASGLDYLALGHWHSFRQGRSGRTTWAYSGAPEPVALDQDGAGQILMVDLERRDGRASVNVQPVPVGRTKFEKVDVDAATVASQADLERAIRQKAAPDTVFDVRLVGIRADTLDLNIDELERQLQGAFMGLRIRDASVPSLTDIQLAPADTIVGAFARDLAARISEHDERGETERAAELREALRVGLLLLDDSQRVTLA